MQFEDLRLSEPLLRAVRSARYAHPTPIQAQAVPLVLAGRDVLGCAQTGTGKTAAFALPVLQRLADSTVNSSARSKTSARRIRTLVLCPTRELAQQIHDSFRTYGQHTGLRQTVVFGGVKQGPQARALSNGVDILVATPGRLLDFMGQGLANVKGVEILILDEADRMLDMGFMPDLRRILTHVPRKRQTLLFSATMPSPIRKLAEDILNNPASVEVARVSSPAPSVAHWVYHVEKSGKPALLAQLLTDTLYTRVLVFTRTKHGADKVVKQLRKAGVNAAAMHGNKSQGQRTRALADFRSAKTPVLVATDIAARGLDVEDISHVINYDLTHEPETYVHRIGRTGRAGATGTAMSFCTSEEHADLRAIERLLRQPLQCVGDPPVISDTQPAASRASVSRDLRGSSRGDSRRRSRTNSRPGTGQSRPARSQGMQSRRSRRGRSQSSAAAS